MDIPITLRFFEKLNLFLEIRRIDRENRPQWKIEKSILSWAADPLHHRHLNTPLTVQMARDHSEITGMARTDPDNKDLDIQLCFGNLVIRDLATWSGPDENGIRFTKSGFSVGEVINDLIRNPRRMYRYYFFYLLSWLIFFAGATIIIADGIKAVLPLVHVCCKVVLYTWGALKSLFWHLSNAFQY
jgi:hypothetical protein